MTAELQKQFEFEKKLAQHEFDAEIRLLKQSVLTLQEKIKEQDNLIKQLNSRSDLAGKQVQDIALKAIEGAASSKHYTFPEKKDVKE